MKRAFTLIELLVVIAIIAILAAILFPVFAQAKASAKSAADLSNVKQFATSTLIYNGDYDDYFPLQSGLDVNQWGYGYMLLAPWNWPVPDGGIASRRMLYSESTFMNTVYPYTKDWDLAVCPGAPTENNFHSAQSYPVATGMLEEKTTYAYNGFLSQYAESQVADPAQCPLLSESNGFAAGVGVTLPNPELVCPDPTQPCMYQPPTPNGCASVANGGTANGGTGEWFGQWAGQTLWCNKKGQNWSLTDGHAKFRNLGMTLAPANTDANVDPWTQYAANGTAGLEWWDGCHEWLFRPDYANE